MIIYIICAKTFRTRKNFPGSNATLLPGFLGLCPVHLPIYLKTLVNWCSIVQSCILCPMWGYALYTFQRVEWKRVASSEKYYLMHCHAVQCTVRKLSRYGIAPIHLCPHQGSKQPSWDTKISPNLGWFQRKIWVADEKGYRKWKTKERERWHLGTFGSEFYILLHFLSALSSNLNGEDHQVFSLPLQVNLLVKPNQTKFCISNRENASTSL